jgi:hypothetical protein
MAFWFANVRNDDSRSFDIVMQEPNVKNVKACPRMRRTPNG